MSPRRSGDTGPGLCRVGARSEILDQCFGTRIARIAVFLQALVDDTLQLARDARQLRHRLLQDVDDRPLRGASLEWRAPRQHLVQHDAKRPEVGALIDGQALSLFGRHVHNRADDQAVHRAGRARDGDGIRGREILDRPREAEIEDLHDPGRRDLDVGWLQVAMHDPVVVRRLQRLGDLPGDWDRVGRRNGTGSDPIGERGALDQLHHQVVLTDVVKGADVGMVQGRNRASFALETLAELLAADLDGHGAMKPGVARRIHVAHATRTDRTEDLETSEEGAGGEEHRCADYRPPSEPLPHSHERFSQTPAPPAHALFGRLSL